MKDEVWSKVYLHVDAGIVICSDDDMEDAHRPEILPHCRPGQLCGWLSNMPFIPTTARRQKKLPTIEQTSVTTPRRKRSLRAKPRDT